MLGNIQFIGELYKKSMLKENVMKTCVEHLLNAQKEVNADRTLKGLKFISGDVDEDNLEVSYHSLLCALGMCVLCVILYTRQPIDNLEVSFVVCAPNHVFFFCVSVWVFLYTRQPI